MLGMNLLLGLFWFRTEA